MRKLELVRAFQMEQENPHLAAYKKMFPNARPNIFQMELIEAWVTDEQAWQATLEFWCGNDYRPQSVHKMLEYYKEQVKGESNGTHRNTNERAQRAVDKHNLREQLKSRVESRTVQGDGTADRD